MSDVIKPDLVLNMKREWFVKVWNGEKNIEYRKKKPYWDRRLEKWLDNCHGFFVLMVWGYRKSTPAMLLQVSRVDIGSCPYEKWDGEYYRIYFEICGYYAKIRGKFYPLLMPPKMKDALKDIEKLQMKAR